MKSQAKCFSLYHSSTRSCTLPNGRGWVILFPDGNASLRAGWKEMVAQLLAGTELILFTVASIGAMFWISDQESGGNTSMF